MNTCWHIHYGSWWAIQWCFDFWFSFGIHFDLKNRTRADGKSYGPYVDFHLFCFIVSLGYHPNLSGDIEKLIGVSRGGE